MAKQHQLKEDYRLNPYGIHWGLYHTSIDISNRIENLTSIRFEYHHFNVVECLIHNNVNIFYQLCLV